MDSSTDLARFFLRADRVVLAPAGATEILGTQIFAQFGVSIFRVFLVRIPLRLALGVMGIKVEEKHADLRRLGLR